MSIFHFNFCCFDLSLSSLLSLLRWSIIIGVLFIYLLIKGEFFLFLVPHKLFYAFFNSIITLLSGNCLSERTLRNGIEYETFNWLKQTVMRMSAKAELHGKERKKKWSKVTFDKRFNFLSSVFLTRFKASNIHYFQASLVLNKKFVILFTSSSIYLLLLVVCVFSNIYFFLFALS